MSRRLPGSAIVPGSITLTQISGSLNDTTNAAYAQANSARDQANTARTTANDAYATANSRLPSVGGTLSGDLIITGNLTVSGNQTILNTEVLTTEDADIILLSNVAGTPALNAGLIVNRGTSTNTFIRWAENVDEWGWSDNGTVTYFFDDLRQGLITTNTTFGTINTNITNTNSNAVNAYASANLAYTQANNARSDANTTFATVNTTFATINTTTATMNTATSNRVLKAGDTMTGNLIVSGATVNTATANITTIVTGNALTLSTGTSSNANIIFSANGAENMRILTNGNVGIGTTSPSQRLTVNGNINISSSSPFISLDGAGSGGPPAGIGYGMFGFGGIGLGIYSAHTSIAFFTNNPTANQEAMRIVSGNVGIGTTNPQALIHLGSAAVNTAGDIDTTHTKLIIKQTSNSNKGGLYIERSGERRGFYIWMDPSGGAGDGLTFTRNNNGTVANVLTLDRDGSAHFALDVLLTRATRPSIYSNTTNVGLQVRSNGTGVLELNTDNVGNVEIAKGGGNVSIGTASAGYRLDIYNIFNGAPAAVRLYGNDQSNVRLRLENIGTGGRTWEIVGGLPGLNNSNFSIRNVTSSTTPVTIDASGNTTFSGPVEVSGGMRSVVTFNASGNYLSNTWYTLATQTTLPNEGLYAVIAYVDTYSAGGGFYFMRFGSVTFYWYPAGSNGGETYELPAMIGTGHAANAEPPPKIRVRQTLSGAGYFIEFQPGANWTGINGSAGRNVIFEVRRIA